MAMFRAGPHEFRIHFTVGVLGTIKREHGVDFAGALASGEQFAAAMTEETEKLFEALWVACEEQAKGFGLTKETFANLLDGDVMESATYAMLESAVDFFPKARGRDAIKKGLPRAMEKIARDVNSRIEANLSTFLPTAGNSGASSGSTPAS